jgi:hypothetical protein
VRPGGVVVVLPGFDQDLRLAQIEEYLSRQKLVAELGAEPQAGETNAYDQKWPLCVGLSRTHEPSFSQRRPRFG